MVTLLTWTVAFVIVGMIVGVLIGVCLGAGIFCSGFGVGLVFRITGDARGVAHCRSYSMDSDALVVVSS